MQQLKTLGKYAIALLLCIAILVGAGNVYYKYLPSLQQEHRLKQYTNIIWKYAQEYSVPTQLIKSVIIAESNVYPDIVSQKGAKGLMQVTEAAQKDVVQKFELEKGSLFDPDHNIQVGTAYLRILIDLYDNDIVYVLAAYNAGRNNVRKWRAEMPGKPSHEVIAVQGFPETKSYIKIVLGK